MLFQFSDKSSLENDHKTQLMSFTFKIIYANCTH